MLGRPMPYILNLKNIESDDLELAGSEAITNSMLYDESVKTTDGFVLTTRAFDDFITAANLIEPISESLQRVKPFSKLLSQKASEEISALILNSPLPNILERPLREAYKHLGDHGNPYVFVSPSNIIDHQFLPDGLEKFREINVRGEKELIYKIKECWLSLFTAEAIEWRVNKNYGGVLSIGVLVKKMVQSEISGRAYSFSPTDNNKSVIEIQAVYGFDDPKLGMNQDADIYKVDKKSLTVVEKNIIQQDNMIVRRGNHAPGENPNIKIEISNQWKKTQKIDDKKIEDLALRMLSLENIYGKPIEVTWGLELGDFTVLNLSELNTHAKIKPVQASEVIEKIKVEEYIPTQEIEVIPHNKIVEIEHKIEAKVEDLVEEVQKLVHIEPLPTMEEFIPEDIHQQKLDHIEKQVEITEPSGENFEFLTAFYLDVSKMNTEVLTSVKKFNGAYLDGTEIILTNSALPEHIVESEFKLNQAMNIFTMDIATSARILEKNSLIYQLSDINSEKLKLLGIEEGKVKHFSDERFIENPESLTVEILALKKARNQMNYKNIDISIPSIRSYDNLIKIKKMIATQGLRRSSSLKMFAEVSTPSFIFELKRIEDGDIDGLIIDYEKLFTNSTGKNTIKNDDHKIILNQIAVIKDIIIGKNLDVWVKIRDNEYSEEVINSLMKFGLGGIILRDIPKNSLHEIVTKAEYANVQNLKTRKKKRGRIIKDLF